jgi:hypothetical protein
MENQPNTPNNTTLPKGLDQYNEIVENVYQNGKGATHYYGIDQDGKKRHISGDSILESYGYDPSVPKENFDAITTPNNDDDQDGDDNKTSHAKSSVYGYKGSELLSSKEEFANDPYRVKEQLLQDGSQTNEHGYAGPVSKGSEIELYDSRDKRGDEEPHDSRRDEDTFGFYYDEDAQEWVKQFEIPGFDMDHLETLHVASDRYALETAKSRQSYLGRFASTDSRTSRFLRKIPGVKNIINAVNNRSDQNVVGAKNEYIEARNAVGADAAVQLRQEGYSEEQISHLSILGRMEWDSRLEDGTSVIQGMRINQARNELQAEIARLTEAGEEPTMGQVNEMWDSTLAGLELQPEAKGIVGHRHEQGKESTKFSDWWHKQKGFKGVIKRYGGMFAAGVAAGALLPATLSGIAGIGLTAGGLELARRMNARRANSDSGVGADGTKVTWAEMQSIADKYTNELHAKGNWFDEDGNFLSENFDLEANGGFDSTIHTTEKRTNEEMTKNRRKIVATTLSTLGGWGLGEVVDAVTDSDLPNIGGSENPDTEGGERPLPGDGDLDPRPQPEVDDPTLGGVTADPEITGIEIIDPENPLGDDVAEGVATPEFDTSGYEYPWDWASEQYGSENATAVLENLAQRASEDGHDVEWHGTGTGRWIEIDGISEASNAQGTGTLDVLSQYAAEMNSDLEKLAEAQPTLPVTS